MSAAVNRIRAALRRLRSSERGIALPMAMLATAIGLTFATVVVASSINTQGGDVHDQASNSALAAAESGADIAVLRQNRMAGEIRETGETCVVVGAEGQLESALPSEGWCPPVVMNASSDPAAPSGTEVTYRVKPEYSSEDPSADNTISVVATGSTIGSRPVSRRIMVEASAGLSSEQKANLEKIEEEITREEEILKESEGAATYNPFSYGQVTGLESLYLSGNSKIYQGGAGSNGRVQIIDSSLVCGGLRYGPGYPDPVGGVSYVPEPERQYSNGTGGGVCYPGPLPTQGIVEYTPVTLPENIATSNSDTRLNKQEDPGVSDCGHEYCNISWNFANRSLAINYGSLTLGGSEYFLCSLTIASGSILAATPGAKVRIFFDEPKNCPGLNGAAQLTIDGGATIKPDSGEGPGFYLLGSASNPSSSKVYFTSGAATARLVIYAPNSVVQIAGGINLNGAILGRTLRIEGGANINQNSPYTPPPASEYTTPPQNTSSTEVEEIEEKITKLNEEKQYKEVEAGSFKRGAFLECSSTPSNGQLPNTGC